MRKRVQERFGQTDELLVAEEIALSEEAQDCLRRAVMALVADLPQPDRSRQVSPELLALSLFANQHVLASVATLAVLVQTRLIEQIGAATFQRMERRFLFARSSNQDERISLQYVTIGRQRRILKSVEPPQYRFRDLVGLGPVHRDVQSLVVLLENASKQPAKSRGLLLIEPQGKRIKQLARAIAGEAGVPLTIIFCPVLAEIWQESKKDRQPATILRELFLSLRLLSASLIYLEDLDALTEIDQGDEPAQSHEPPEPGQSQDSSAQFWPAFLQEIDKLLGRSGMVLLAATSKPAALAPELLTSTRLGHGLVVEIASDDISERQSVRPGKKARQHPMPVARKQCPVCSQPIQEHWQHCVYCGAAIASLCPNCGTPRPEIAGARFCYRCGKRLE